MGTAGTFQGGIKPLPNVEGDYALKSVSHVSSYLSTMSLHSTNGRYRCHPTPLTLVSFRSEKTKEKLSPGSLKVAETLPGGGAIWHTAATFLKSIIGSI